MLIGTASDAAVLLLPLLKAEGERVAVLHLGNDRRLLAVTVEESGSFEQDRLPVAAVLAKGLRLGATGMIVGCNRVRRDVSPTEDEVAATRALAEGAAQLGIQLFDHLILFGEEWLSFRSLGLL